MGRRLIPSFILIRTAPLPINYRGHAQIHASELRVTRLFNGSPTTGDMGKHAYRRRRRRAAPHVVDCLDLNLTGGTVAMLIMLGIIAHIGIGFTIGLVTVTTTPC